MEKRWVVWCNAYKTEFEGPLLTYSVMVAAKTRNEALKLGNRKLGIPLKRRDRLKIYRQPSP